MEILLHPKSQTDIHRLLEEVNRSPFIGHVSANEMDEYIQNQTVRFFYYDGHLVGFGAWQPIEGGWCEIGPFYVVTQYRGKGIGNKIAATLTELTPGHQLVAVTKNAVVKRMLEKHGFQRAKFSALAPPVRLHIRRRLTFWRLLKLLRKISLEPPAYYVRVESDPS
jgi:GNAT superfamily N-acetyltransferase